METKTIETMQETTEHRPSDTHFSTYPSIQQTPVEGGTPLTKMEGETPPRTEMKVGTQPHSKMEGETPSTKFHPSTKLAYPTEV